MTDLRGARTYDENQHIRRKFPFYDGKLTTEVVCIDLQLRRKFLYIIFFKLEKNKKNSVLSTVSFLH